MEIESGSTARIASAQSAAAKAEREAAERVTQAQKQIRDADREAQIQLDHLRDQYEKRTEAERARGEDYIESVRNRTYENLSDFRQKSESEQQRIARESDQNLRNVNSHYEKTIHETSKRGEEQLRDTTKKNFSAYEYERKRGADEIEELKSNFSNQKAALLAGQEIDQLALAKTTQEARELNAEKTRTAIEASTEHYQDAYEGALKQTQDSVTDVNWRASRDIEALKRDTAMKLSAYSSQKSDPFYRMVNMNAEIRENDDQFILTAKVPSHERDKININIRGNEIVVSGQRKSNETLEVEPGRKQTTSSFQSFSESFPLNWPVNPKFMTREWDGDTLVVRIPKRSTYEAPRPNKIATRATLERPNFPANLPTEESLVRGTPVAENETTPPSRRKKAGSTLA